MGIGYDPEYYGRFVLDAKCGDWVLSVSLATGEFPTFFHF
jgi:hypothetical protein